MLIRCDGTKNPVGTDTEMVGRPCQCQACAAARRIAELEAALRNLVADCDDYARINNLSGTWATIEQARAALTKSTMIST